MTFFFKNIKTVSNDAKKLEFEGNYKEADNTLTNAIDQTKKRILSGLPVFSGDATLTYEQKTQQLSKLHNQRGVVKRMLGEYEDSFEDYVWALNYSKRIDNKPQEALAHINMADIYRVAKSEFTNAHDSLDKAIDAINNGELNGGLLHAKAVDQKGLVYIAEKKFDAAIDAYDEAKKICGDLYKEKPKDSNIAKRYAEVLQHLGGAYFQKGDTSKKEEAYQLHQTALEIYKELGDQQGIVKSVTGIGNLAGLEDDYDFAIEKYKEACEILKETGYKRAITSLAFHIAEAYAAKGNISNAEPYLKRFAKGVLEKEFTPHDMGIIKDMFNTLYDSVKSLNIENLDSVSEQFSKI